MRRNDAPYNGKQFILNKSTGEIHDLDRESSLCCIDQINTDTVLGITRNGCAHCMPERNRG